MWRPKPEELPVMSHTREVSAEVMPSRYARHPAFENTACLGRHSYSL
jgi:hypothetical protein